MANKVSKKNIFLLLIIVINLAIIAIAYFATPALSYQLNEDEISYSVTGISPFRTSVTVPSLNKGLPVTKIADRAFSYSGMLKRVTFAEDSQVCIIGERSFERCYGLRKITLPDSLEGIENYAFSNCRNLDSIAIPDNVKYIGAYAFADRWRSSMRITEVTFGEESKLIKLGANAFRHCRQLKSIILPPNLTKIENSTFFECNSLTSVTIPKGVREIGYMAFYNCFSLQSFEVAEGSTYFKSVEGVLFNISETELKAYPVGNSRTSYIVPNKVRYIRANAFSGCKNLESITLPENIRNISAAAFADCDNLTSIIIERVSPPDIEENIFENANSNLKIYVPSQSLNDYKNDDDWGAYSSFIYANTHN